jgi:mono/diheme cytochrome c family protein
MLRSATLWKTSRRASFFSSFFGKMGDPSLGRVQRMRTLPTLVIVIVGLCACSHTGGPRSTAASPAGGANSMLANGRDIFLTGKDAEGVQITAAKPPLRPYCSACHLANGAGGVKFPDGAVSADLRHKALVIDQKHPYTLALLKRAISTGIDNDGEKLDPAMPRWALSTRDLHDVAWYVLTQLHESRVYGTY